MRRPDSAICKLLLPLCLAILFPAVCQGQSGTPQKTDAAANWKISHLAELAQQFAVETTGETEHEELRARRAWLENWEIGSMPTESRKHSQLPNLRTEPILNSNLAAEFRKRLNWENTERDESEFLNLERIRDQHPDDIGLQQLHLHWMDFPIRRKSYLEQIDESALRLIKTLEANKVSVLTNQLAIEFTMYRRGRALAYRELPDVVKQTPIKDPQRLNKEILSAYEDLIASAGKGRSEFILLEIRILRRAKSFGKALALVEQYGSLIKPQWYLKKRRDLLREIDWEFPYAEAAKIYANEFPDEVAKESK